MEKEVASREEMIKENPLAVEFLDAVLMEMIVIPNLDYVNPSLTRENILKKLWNEIKNGNLTIYFDEESQSFSWETNLSINELLGG